MTRSTNDLEDYVGEQLLRARKLPVSHRETDAERGLGETWAIGPVGQTRDSDALEQTNFAAAFRALEEVDPDDVEVLRFGHFAVGWVEEIAWRAVDGRGRITKTAEAAFELHERLESYPVLDEAAHSEAEMEAQLENVRDALETYYRRNDGEDARGMFFRRWEDESRQDELVHEVWGVLSDGDRAGDEQRSVRRDDLVEALIDLNLIPETGFNRKKRAKKTCGPGCKKSCCV